MSVIGSVAAAARKLVMTQRPNPLLLHARYRDRAVNGCAMRHATWKFSAMCRMLRRVFLESASAQVRRTLVRTPKGMQRNKPRAELMLVIVNAAVLRVKREAVQIESGLWVN